jgi:hypothetical protein
MLKPLLSSVGFLFSTALWAASTACVLPAPKYQEIDRDNSKVLVEFFELKAGPVWESALSGETPALNRYLQQADDVIEHFNSRALLERQRPLMSQVDSDYLRRYELILNGEVGRIQSTTCLESLLYNRHLERVSGAYSEFGAWVLKSKDGKTLKVYFISNSAPFVPMPAVVQGAVNLDLQMGATAVLHLHNHPFQLPDTQPMMDLDAPTLWGTPSWDLAGTIYPSGLPSRGWFGDLLAWESFRETYDLKEARITNGLDTIRFSPDEWKKLF